MQANADVHQEMLEGELEQCRKSNVALRRRAEAAELRLAQAGLQSAEMSAATLKAVQVVFYPSESCAHGPQARMS